MSRVSTNGRDGFFSFISYCEMIWSKVTARKNIFNEGNKPCCTDVSRVDAFVLPCRAFYVRRFKNKETDDVQDMSRTFTYINSTLF